MCLGECMVPMVGQKISKDVRAKVVAKDALKHAETIRIGNDWEMSPPSPSTYKMVPGCFRFVGCQPLMVCQNWQAKNRANEYLGPNVHSWLTQTLKSLDPSLHCDAACCWPLR